MAEDTPNGAEQQDDDGHIDYVEKMPGLNAEDSGLARTYAHREGVNSDVLDTVSESSERALRKADVLTDAVHEVKRNRGTVSPDLVNVADNARIAVDKAAEVQDKYQDKRDANLWRSQQHYKEHEGEYREQGKQDAAERGIDIKDGTEEQGGESEPQA